MTDKRSGFLDMLRAPKTDLRRKYNCADCGVKITSKNFGMSSSAFEGNGWAEEEVYCNQCFLKPKALGVKGEGR